MRPVPLAVLVVAVVATTANAAGLDVGPTATASGSAATDTCTATLQLSPVWQESTGAPSAVLAAVTVHLDGNADGCSDRTVRVMALLLDGPAVLTDSQPLRTDGQPTVLTPSAVVVAEDLDRLRGLVTSPPVLVELSGGAR